MTVFETEQPARYNVENFWKYNNESKKVSCNILVIVKSLHRGMYTL